MKEVWCAPPPAVSQCVSAGGDGSFEKTVVCAVNAYGGLQSKADGEGVTKVWWG